MTDNTIALPNHYIEKVSLTTGEVIDEAFDPCELLVDSHRDHHIVDTYSRHLMSVLMKATGDEEAVKKTMKGARGLGKSAAEYLAKAVGKDPNRVAESLFGLKDREFFFRFKNRISAEIDIPKRVRSLVQETEAALKSTEIEGQPRLQVLLTGGTGFVGKELIWQAAWRPEVEKMYVVIRPQTVRDPKTKEVIKVLSPQERGQDLLKQLWLEGSEVATKFHFVAGDIEKPNMGLEPAVLEELKKCITNVIHCAASVAFDDPYEESFSANVLGSRNALAFSLNLQNQDHGRFVSHLSIETSYIHGRQTHREASEDEIVFPRNFYNNYYELTKALASMETEETMLENGLRVVQLCPSIVIGEGRTGNNRGDLKVVNAPVNAFGLARIALKERQGDLLEWSKAKMIAQLASVFPGDTSAELNLIPVDWVALGILQALTRPKAVGQRVHLATDSRITAANLQKIMREELRVKVKLAEPTLHRNVQLPVLAKVLEKLNQPKLAHALTKLGTIFGGYSEWGQPVHEVGNDVAILGMPEPRPRTDDVFRMLCRHNKYVQKFGKIRDLDEISRREKSWLEFIKSMEKSLGQPAAQIPPSVFHQKVKNHLHPETLEYRPFELPKKELLSRADAAWLHMDRPDNLMMITALFLFEKPVEYHRLSAVLEERLLPFDRFRMRVKRSRNPLRRPSWVAVPEFRLEDHLLEGHLENGSLEELYDLVGQRMSQRLSRRKPLWRLELVQNVQGGSAIIATLHHAIADGYALMKILMSLTDAPDESQKELHFRQKDREIKVEVTNFVDLGLQSLAASAELGRNMLDPEPDSPLRGPLGQAKGAAVSNPIALEDIKACRHLTGATVNDVLVAALTGGIRQTLLRSLPELSESTNIRAVVPVDLRKPEDDELGNRFGLVFLSLPVGLSDPHDRLVEVKSRMDELKSSPQAVIVFGLLTAVGAIPAELEKRVVSMFGTRATAVLTNVPGPKDRLLLAGQEIASLMFWVPQSGGLALGLSILSYAGQVRVGIACDKGLIPEPTLLVKDFEAAFYELLESQTSQAGEFKGAAKQG